MAKTNVKVVLVRFTRIYNNPTFKSLFGRFNITTVGTWVELSVNHNHYSDIVKMASVFNYEVSFA